MSQTEIGWQVIVSPTYLKERPSINRRHISDRLLESPWSLPILDSNQWIPGMGTTGHKAMPTAAAIGRNGRNVDLFVKPFDDVFLAGLEFRNNEVVYKRGINIPPLVALIMMGENAILVGRLLHNVEPLSVRDLTYKTVDPRVHTPGDMLEFFTGSIAFMHNQGIVHGDLHTGNLGYQYQEDRIPKPVFFDFESAFVLSDQDLMDNKAGSYKTEEQKKRLKFFGEQAVVDLATFAANLRFHGFPIRKYELLEEISRLYFEKRIPALDAVEGENFTRLLREKYEAMMRSLKAAV